ncbi:MAG: methyl-accepting chemotaxis protein [Treponema sp.]|nr:methyl-accepting chemotaxis protein [Treponema sp.]
MNNSFESETFIKCIPYNIIEDIIILSYGIFFTEGIRPIIVPTVIIFIAVILIKEFIIELPIHKLITRTISNDIAYANTDASIDNFEKTNLIQRVMRIPLYKGMEIYLLFICKNILLAVIEYAYLGLDFNSSIKFFFICTSLSYIAFTITIHNMQKICSKTTIKISESGIVSSIIDKHHFFGMSLFRLFSIYVLFSIINNCLFFILATILGYKLSTIISIAVTNILVLTMFSYFFFSRIKLYSNQMTGTLNSLIQNKIKRTELLPNDFSTEISYSMYLLNKTNMTFRELLSKTTTLNNIIKESSEHLSSIANQTQATSLEQSSTTQEITSTIKHIFENAKVIQSKIDEVINVADKTESNVDSNFKSLEQNQNMMSEITTANQDTINGIQNLSNMIPKIQEIVNFINSVASQTKIIAFNAELEASDIDQKTTIFQNVAKEIRILADNTLDLTKDIKNKIHDIEDASRQLIETGQDCMNKIQEGTLISSELENKFLIIQKSARETSNNSKIIKDSIYSQTTILEHSVNSLQQINGNLIKFTDSTKKISSTVSNLQNESIHIKELTQEN